MIGLDTNIVVRYLVADDAHQLAAVDQLIDEALARGELLHLNNIVLCETVWVLESVYRYAKSEVIGALEAILATSQFSISSRETVQEALELYREGKADFSDFLIGGVNQGSGCRFSVTFEKALKNAAAFRRLDDNFSLADHS